jgi:hypothetical protein
VLRLDGLPATVLAGGQVQFSARLTNGSGADMVFLPAIRLVTRDGKPAPSDVTVAYRRSGEERWQDSAVPQSSATDGVHLLGPVDEHASDGFVPAPEAATVTFDVRLRLPESTPADTLALSFLAYWAAAGDSEPSLSGLMASTEPDDFCVTRPSRGPHPSESPSTPAPSGSSAPSPSVSPSVSPVASTPVASPTSVQQSVSPAAVKLASTGGGTAALTVTGFGAMMLGIGAGVLTTVRRRRAGALHRARR